MGKESAVLTLLELGADPRLGSKPALHSLVESAGYAGFESGIRIAEALLQHGAVCLLPFNRSSYGTLLDACFEMADGDLGSAHHKVALACLAHLERQRAAGQLELGSTERAAQLLLAATLSNHAQLLRYGISSLEALLAAGEDGVTGEEAVLLIHILDAAIAGNDSSAPATLQALLTSALPFEVDGFHVHCAALARSSPAAKVQLLRQTGVEVTAADLLHIIDNLSATGVAALLSAFMPAMDTSQPSFCVNGHTSYSCPIHRALRAAVRWPPCPSSMTRLAAPSPDAKCAPCKWQSLCP